MFSTLFRDLRSLAVSNIEYFQSGNTNYHARFHQTFSLLFEHLDRGIQPAIEDISSKLSYYDLSPDIQANGHRSLLKIVHKCCVHLLQLSRYINTSRDSFFFRRSHTCKELESYVETLGQLRACLYYAQRLMAFCDEGNLFADEDNLNNPVADMLMEEVELLRQDSFYGRCLGFQFCESLKRPLNVVMIAMASFSEGYQESSHVLQFASSIMNSGKYMMSPELRAEQVVKVTRTADVKFCKAFWSLTEMDVMKQVPSLVCPHVQVNQVMYLQPEPFELPIEGSIEMATITPPCAHTGYGPVRVRLISFEYREGQELNQTGFTKKKPPLKPLPMSSSLVIHCHGGGFVAHSSKSHEVYLRQWAMDLDVPILSIDYSLAPELPFPRALEECFYAYCWALKNCHKLGSTGEMICVAGDSAGGNLMTSTSLRAGSFGIRVPDGIMAAYTPFLAQYTPSPSRLMCLMDPLLPVGILARCLAAYAGVGEEFTTCLSGIDLNKSRKPTLPDVEEWVNIEAEEVTEARQEETSEPFTDLDPSYKGLTESQYTESFSSDAQSSECLTKSTNNDSMEPFTDIDEKCLNSDGSSESFTEINQAPECSGGQDDPSSEIDFSCVDLNDTEQQTVSKNIQGPGAGCVQETGAPSKRDNLTLPSSCSHSRIDTSNTCATNFTSSIPRSPSAPVISNACADKERKFSPIMAHNRPIVRSPLQIMRKLPIVKNPYMSPLLSPDDMLMTLPPVYLVACHLDPLLDDSVMFAKKLRRLGKSVDLHLIDDLPHGFLNFALVSSDAKRASDVCVDKIRKILHQKEEL